MFTFKAFAKKLSKKICFGVLVYSVFKFSFILHAQDRIITIDLAQELGPIRLTVGTNGGPISLFKPNVSYNNLYHTLGVQAIRTHDYYGPCDWSTIFPNWLANTNDPSSYNFGSTDTVIANIINNGFKVLFRLGPSWRGKNPAFTNDPPGTIRDGSAKIIHVADTTDFKKFAEICKHIIMHYNDGWANGFHYNINHWEVWNEPSLSSQFWSGTSLQFQQMFVIVLKTLKAYNPNLQLGGPGQEGNVSLQYERNLIVYCQINNTPLDFYSYHSYGGEKEYITPWRIASRALDIRSLLDNSGYQNTKIVCDEFNAGVNEWNFSNSGRGAAFHASALAYMVFNGLDAGYNYRSDDHPLGFITNTGVLKIAGESYKAWKILTALPIRVSSSGSDTLGFTVIATKDSAQQMIRILISNYPSNAQNLKMHVTNLSVPNGTKWSYTCRAIDDTHRLILTDSTVRIVSARTLSSDFIIPSGAVYLFELKRVSETDIQPMDLLIPQNPFLYQNYPNPFNPVTKISWQSPVDGHLTLKVFDILGNEVATLVDEFRPSGSYEVDFNANQLSTGVYFYKLQSGSFVETKKMILIK